MEKQGKPEKAPARPAGVGYTSGSFPKDINTVRAGVLAAMLDGECITGMDAVFAQHTTRAAGHIHALKTEHGWLIQRRRKAVGTSDGRVAWIAEYWLSAETRVAAFAAGAGPWIRAVEVAAAARRNEASAATTEAARLNVCREAPEHRHFFPEGT